MLLSEGLRMWRRARRVRREGFTRYEGLPEQVCLQILADCWDEQRQYFRVSPGHFCEFYTRDFALCCESLVEIGYAARVRKTLQYALGRFERHGRMTVAIGPDGTPFDYFLPSGPETVALFLYACDKSRNIDLLMKHKAFLQKEIDRIVHACIDSATLLPRVDRSFSTIRDHAKRKAPCYDAIMIALLAREAHHLGFRFPYDEKKIVDAIRTRYWNGAYFFQDLNRQDVVAGDANVFPFWTGLFTDREVRTRVITSICAAKLDDPLPLRYVSPHDARREKTKLSWVDLLAPDYETTSLWAHLGLAYVRVLAEDDPARARAHLAQYETLIEKYRTFLEVYEEYEGGVVPFSRLLYASDEGMLWCANWLALTRHLTGAGRPSLPRKRARTVTGRRRYNRQTERVPGARARASSPRRTTNKFKNAFS